MLENVGFVVVIVLLGLSAVAEGAGLAIGLVLLAVGLLSGVAVHRRSDGPDRQRI